ncbi:MAG TPA: CapA family protein, partial [Kofleriaceae bacterium]|nr:CapA family protein [Kofleriaceae bacterium]
PAWNALAVDGHHPLDPDPGTALTVPLCAPGGLAARNIDPARLTSLAMTGTTALTRGTARMIERLGLDHATRDVEPWLRAADLVHISNEVSMVPDCDPNKNVPYTFCSRESYLKILEDSHAKIIELTGSHLTDYGRRWLTHTLDLYRQRGWVWFGGGRDQLEGTAVLTVEHHGNRLGFIGCNEVYTGQIITEGPGPAACDFDRMVWQVGEMRRKGLVPVVSIQHEEVYIHDPPSSLVHDFRRLAEAGAAVVFGSQAHTAHPWEVHHGAFLHYGAGNFYFDQAFSHTPEGVADRLYFHAGRLLAVGRLFTRVEDNGRPRPMTARERAHFLEEMAACLGKLPRGAPWGTPRVPDERPRPDSFLIGKQQQFLTVIAPESLDEKATYPLVIDLAGTHRDPAAFVVRLRRPRVQPPAGFLDGAIDFMTAKYPIDPERVRIHMRPGRLDPPPGRKPPPKPPKP